MIEILVVYHLCRKIGRSVSAKGRRTWPYQLLLVGVWLGSEIVGVIIGLLIFGMEATLEPYLMAIGAACIGSFIVFWRVGSLRDLRGDALTEVFE